MKVTTACPDRASLELLLEKGGVPDEIDRLAAHLESCTRCGETVEALFAADPTAAVLRGAKVEAEGSSIQFLRERLAKLRSVAFAPLDATTAGNLSDPPPAAVVPPTFEVTQDLSVSLAPPQQPDEIGRLGGYRILKELGRGGMGVVYLAEDVKLKRLVALKAMLPKVAADAPSRQRFLREAQAMAAVRHDHIVTIFQVEEVAGVPFLAMELLEGTPLDRWLKDDRQATVAQVLRLGREIADGLAAAHERGLIHRDVKPGNIWLDSAHQGRVKILDFGLARAGKEDVHLTRSGAIVGTPAYMSPEQARGEKLDPRSDLFSLGCVLYRLCTGAMPFTGDTTMSLLLALAMDPPRPVREINANVPPELADLVMKLLEKDPARRPASAREVVQAIQALEKRLAGRPERDDQTEALPAPVARTAPAVPPRRRTGALIGLLLGGAAAVAVVATVVVIIRNKNGDKIAEVNVPPGGKVEVVDDGKKDVAPKAAVDDAWLKRVAALPAEKQVEAVADKLKDLNPGFDGQVTPTIEDGVVTSLDFSADQVTDLSPVRALPGLTSLVCIGSQKNAGKLTDLSPLKGMKLTGLSVCYTHVADLTPLKGMSLEFLNFAATRVSDLSALRDMKVTRLYCNDTQVQDLSPLKDRGVEVLDCSRIPASDLSPLKGLTLHWLKCQNMPESCDLSPLKDLPLAMLWCDFKPERDADVLRSITTLEKINDKPAAEFWKGVDAAVRPPLNDAWIKQVAALPAEKQVEAVAAELKKRNPGFDGQVKPTTEGGVVTELEFVTDDVTDLSPLRALPGLTGLNCAGSSPGKGRLSDLSPLKDMKLTSLNIGNTPRVSNLSPLKDMKLTYLNCWGTAVSDLSPLKDMKLTNLECGGTAVSDLSPLKGMPLTMLQCWNTKVSDLSPLQDMKLILLHCGGTPVSDLSPLKGMPLTTLRCDGTRVTDHSPLSGMPLKVLACDFKPERDADILRSLQTLEQINDRPAAEFWKGVDAASKPPPDDVWIKQVAALPAEKQVEAVVAELKKRNPGFKDQASPGVENGVVTSLKIVSDDLTDLSPVRAFPGLKMLILVGAGKGRLSDLSPLKGLPLTQLVLDGTKASDLSPLKDLPLANLSLRNTPVSDSDLASLKGMKLGSLDCSGTGVTDLSRLQGLPLLYLFCNDTAVSDLSPLKGMPLVQLDCRRTRVTDLSPLKGTALKVISCDFKPARDADILRSLKGLEQINGKPATDFWKEVDEKKP